MLVSACVPWSNTDTYTIPGLYNGIVLLYAVIQILVYIACNNVLYCCISLAVVPESVHVPGLLSLVLLVVADTIGFCSSDVLPADIFGLRSPPGYSFRCRSLKYRLATVPGYRLQICPVIQRCFKMWQIRIFSGICACFVTFLSWFFRERIYCICI